MRQSDPAIQFPHKLSPCLAENPDSFLRSNPATAGSSTRLAKPSACRRKRPGFSARHAENDSQDLALGNTGLPRNHAVFKMTRTVPGKVGQSGAERITIGFVISDLNRVTR